MSVKGGVTAGAVVYLCFKECCFRVRVRLGLFRVRVRFRVRLGLFRVRVRFRVRLGLG